MRFKKIITVALLVIFGLGFSSPANAITGTIPSPIIGTAQGFYAGNDYPILVGAFSTNWELQPNEVLKISTILIYEVELSGLPCGPLVSGSTLVDSIVKRINDSTTKFDINNAGTFTVPEDSVNKAICAMTQVTTSGGVYQSALTYASVAANPETSASATPEATAQAPTGTKPTFADSPKANVKQKIKIKAWELNGSEFKSRKVTLYSCEKDDCSDKSAENSIVLEGLNYSDEKTVTMETAIPKDAKYVVAYDTVTYDDDKTVELLTNVRTVTAATEATEEATEEATAEAAETEEAEVTTTEEVTPTEEAIVTEEVVAEEVADEQNSGALIAALVVVIAGLLGLIYWLVRKKK
ncbi:MAG: hypothetical protein ACO3O9_05305 [Candidatus Nanopelagicales bacterium]